MSRELVTQLIDKKRAIDADTARLEAEYSQLQDHAWLVDEESAADFPNLNDEELEIQEKLLTLKLSILSNQMRLHRAHLFGPRYSRSFVPTLCIKCFVDHDKKESLMVEVLVGPDCWDGKRQFECPVCKHVLRIDPTLNVETS